MPRRRIALRLIRCSAPARAIARFARAIQVPGRSARRRWPWRTGCWPRGRIPGRGNRAAGRPARPRRSARAPPRHGPSAGRAPRGCRPWRRAGSPPGAAGSRRSRARIRAAPPTAAARRARTASGLRAGLSSAAWVSLAMASSRSERIAASAAPSARRATTSAAIAASRLSSAPAQTAAKLASSSTASTTSTTPRTASTPSMRRRRQPGLGRGGARGRDDLVERREVQSRLRRRALARGRNRRETGAARQAPCRAAPRASPSMRSKPGGRRSRGRAPWR